MGAVLRFAVFAESSSANTALDVDESAIIIKAIMILFIRNPFP